MREDDKKKTKETRRQETVRGRVEYFVVSRKLATRQTRIALKLVTITEQHSLSPSFSRTQEHINPHPPSASLAKVLTAASIYKRRDNAPYHRHSREHGNHSSAYAECFVSNSPYSGKHLQTKRQRHPSPSFSRTRETIRPRPPRVSLAKVLTTTNIYKRRDNTLITVILANAGTHSSASAESFVSKSPHSGKHLQTTRQRPHCRHSRERGNPFFRVRREFR
ncbi:hypothetical protein FORC17_1051 [Vibrio vulnificus]|nr:hypothetical protein FORC17_1051 [Vibrio vulnificus]